MWMQLQCEQVNALFSLQRVVAHSGDNYLRSNGDSHKYKSNNHYSAGGPGGVAIGGGIADLGNGYGVTKGKMRQCYVRLRPSIRKRLMIVEMVVKTRPCGPFEFLSTG